jgi:hypothetical protein
LRTIKTDHPKLNWYESAILGSYKVGRNNHRALILAKRAKRATTDQGLSVGDMWSDIEKHYKTDLELHFSIEESHIGVPLKEIGETEIVKRLYEEHETLLSFFQPGTIRSFNDINRFGELLKKHVRFEERELFETAQSKLGLDMLQALDMAYSSKHPPAPPSA